MSPRPSVQSAARNPYPATGASKTKEFWNERGWSGAAEARRQLGDDYRL